MEKKIVSTRTTSAKRTAKYEIRKEHVVYSDGTTADRLACYDFTGKYLGGIRDAEKKTSVPQPKVVPYAKPTYPKKTTK